MALKWKWPPHNSNWKILFASLAAVCVVLRFNDVVRKKFLCGTGMEQGSQSIYKSKLPGDKTSDILVIMVAFFNVDIVQASLDSVLHGSSGEPFGGDVVVVHQPSVNTQSMSDMLALRGRGNNNTSTGGVLHHILIDESEPLLYGELYAIPFLHQLVDINRYNVSCLSDGDVIMYGDWALEIRNILEKHPEVYSAAVSLNPFNAYSADLEGLVIQGKIHDDFIESITGMQMVCYRTDELITLLQNVSVIVDSSMGDWISSRGRKVARTTRNQLVHMMWSIYTEPSGAHKEYLDFKAAQENLWHPEKKAEDVKFEVLF